MMFWCCGWNLNLVRVWYGKWQWKWQSVYSSTFMGNFPRQNVKLPDGRGKITWWSMRWNGTLNLETKFTWIKTGPKNVWFNTIPLSLVGLNIVSHFWAHRAEWSGQFLWQKKQLLAIQSVKRHPENMATSLEIWIAPIDWDHYSFIGAADSKWSAPICQGRSWMV